MSLIGLGEAKVGGLAKCFLNLQGVFCLVIEYLGTSRPISQVICGEAFNAFYILFCEFYDSAR